MERTMWKCPNDGWKVLVGQGCPKCFTQQGSIPSEVPASGRMPAGLAVSTTTRPACPACGSENLHRLAGKKVFRALVFAPALLGVAGKHWECARCKVRF